MRVIIILLAVVGVILVYLTIGFAIAVKQIPTFRVTAEINYKTEHYRKSSIRAQFTLMVLFWPMLMPAKWYRQEVDKVIDKNDTQALQRRIRELETELYGKPLQ